MRTDLRSRILARMSAVNASSNKAHHKDPKLSDSYATSGVATNRARLDR